MALKANPPSPVTEPPDPAEQTSNSDPSGAPDQGAAEEQQGLDQKPEPELEVRNTHIFGLLSSSIKPFKGKKHTYSSIFFYN